MALDTALLECGREAPHAAAYTASPAGTGPCAPSLQLHGYLHSKSSGNTQRPVSKKRMTSGLLEGCEQEGKDFHLPLDGGEPPCSSLSIESFRPTLLGVCQPSPGGCLRGLGGGGERDPPLCSSRAFLKHSMGHQRRWSKKLMLNSQEDELWP